MQYPELVLGFVAPIGADISGTIQEFFRYFSARGYAVVHLKVTDIFRVLQNYVTPNTALAQQPLLDRYISHIAYGNQIRSEIGPDSILAATTILRIVRKRVQSSEGREHFAKRVYLLHQFKRKEEIDLLRSVYGRIFFQVSVYSRRGARVDYLARRFAGSTNTAMAQSFRADAERLIQIDENEVEAEHGQRVARIFHDADFIVSLDAEIAVGQQIWRFCELLFSSNSLSPSRLEHGMYIAKAAALSTLDLSRQVGAALFGSNAEIISLGCNEVPKAGGGTYWPYERYDDRDYARGYDSNDRRKIEILSELAAALDSRRDLESLMQDSRIRDSQLLDAME